MEQLDDEWEKSFTKGGALCAASLDVLCEFVIKAWVNVKTESVVKSLKNVESQML